MAPPQRRRRRTTKASPAEAHMDSWTPSEREDYRLRQKLQTPLSEVPGLSVRVINTLEDHEILLVGHLMARSDEELLGIANLGEKTLYEVCQALQAFGLRPDWPAAERKKK